MKSAAVWTLTFSIDLSSVKLAVARAQTVTQFPFPLHGREQKDGLPARASPRLVLR